MAFSDLPGINDPQDSAFSGDFLKLLPQFISPGMTDAQIAQAIQNSTWYGHLGSGSNPYAAAFEVGSHLGTTPPGLQAGQVDPGALAAWNQTAVDRSPEGIARANDSGGLFGGGMGSLLGLGLGAAGLYFGLPALGGALGAGGDALALGSEFGMQGDLAGVLAGAGSASTGASAAAGANMFDLGGGLSLDEFGNVTGGLFQGGPGTVGAGDFFSGGASGLDFGSGLNFSDILSGAKNLGGLSSLLGGGSGATNPLSGILKSLGLDPNGGFGSALNLAARTAPGIAALAYANGQPGIDTSGLEGILGKLGGNQDAIVKAATDPLQGNIAAGYGDLLQSQGLRGIRGSSFGDTDIANYIARTGTSLADAGANAAQGSLALQGNLDGNIATLKAQAQKIKNDLFGKAFDVLGRGLNPTPTFNMTGMA